MHVKLTHPFDQHRDIFYTAYMDVSKYSTTKNDICSFYFFGRYYLIIGAQCFHNNTACPHIYCTLIVNLFFCTENGTIERARTFFRVNRFWAAAFGSLKYDHFKCVYIYVDVFIWGFIRFAFDRHMYYVYMCSYEWLQNFECVQNIFQIILWPAPIFYYCKKDVCCMYNVCKWMKSSISNE